VVVIADTNIFTDLNIALYLRYMYIYVYIPHYHILEMTVMTENIRAYKGISQSSGFSDDGSWGLLSISDIAVNNYLSFSESS
jgi:hypothetical protein